METQQKRAKKKKRDFGRSGCGHQHTDGPLDQPANRPTNEPTNANTQKKVVLKLWWRETSLWKEDEGLGKMRHVMTRFLWVREGTNLKHFTLECIDRKEKTANLMTKALTPNTSELTCDTRDKPISTSVAREQVNRIPIGDRSWEAEGHDCS